MAKSIDFFFHVNRNLMNIGQGQKAALEGKYEEKNSGGAKG